MPASYEKYGLKHVINASGRMTILGVSTVSAGVLDAQRFGGEHFFEMGDLMEKTGAHLARLLGVDDAQIVASASAGIAQCVSAVIGRGDRYHARHPYDERFSRHEIVLPKGHNVDYGAPVELMVQLGGGCVVEAGYANGCSADELEVEVGEATAAILYIKSHHAVQKSMLSVSEAARVAHAHGVPLIVDAAAEEDLRAYVRQGADLVIYSGAKAIEGPSAGLVIGSAELVGWVRRQAVGIGRAMKIGKDNVLGFTEAVEEYLSRGPEPGASQRERLAPFVDALGTIPGLSARVVQDSAGRDIWRASVTVGSDAPLAATEVIARLKEGDPAIYVRDYQANNGIIEFDVRSVMAEELSIILSRLKGIMSLEQGGLA